MNEPPTIQPREHVPDPNQIADWLVRDVTEASDGAAGYLDAEATLTGLTGDDLRAVAIELAGRLAHQERVMTVTREPASHPHPHWHTAGTIGFWTGRILPLAITVGYWAAFVGWRRHVPNVVSWP
jgi:hypothetical protein